MELVPSALLRSQATNTQTLGNKVQVSGNARAHIGNSYVANHIYVTQDLAEDVLQRCNASAKDLQPLAKDLAIFRSLLLSTERLLQEAYVSAEDAEHIMVVIKGCKEYLKDSLQFMDNHSTENVESRDSAIVRFQDLAHLRQRLGFHSTHLTALENKLSSSKDVGCILKRYMKDLHSGKIKNSNISTDTVNSLSLDERQAWRLVRKELQNIGITPVLFEKHKDVIRKTLQECVEERALLLCSPQNPLNKSPQQVSTQLQRTQKKISTFDRILSVLYPPAPAALFEAVYQNDMPRLRILLARGANIQSRRSYYGNTPLHTAAQKCTGAVIKLLLDNSADMEARDNDGKTPLHCAVVEGKRAAVQILLDHSANIEARDDAGWTPLQYAVYFGHEAVVQLLLDHSADIEARSNEGETPLHKVITIAEARRRFGYSTEVITKDYSPIIQLLLKHSANTEARDNDRNTPLNLAVRAGLKEIAEILRDHTATQK